MNIPYFTVSQEYAESRMTTYYNLKNTLPASELPDSEDRCADVSCCQKVAYEIFNMDSVVTAKVQTNGVRETSNHSTEVSIVTEDD